MKVRIVGIIFGALALIGVGGAAPASAATPDLCPILYPWCG